MRGTSPSAEPPFDLELRPVRPGDQDRIYRLVERSRPHLSPWMPWVHTTRSTGDIAAFISQALAQEAAGAGFQAGIWWRGELAGVIGFHPIDWQARRVDLGYWLGEGFTGQGLATRSAAALIGHAFEALHLGHVGIRAAEANRPSQLVAERLGFRRTGMVEEGEWFVDHWVRLVVYELGAEEWPAVRSTLSVAPARIQAANPTAWGPVGGQ